MPKTVREIIIRDDLDCELRLAAVVYQQETGIDPGFRVIKRTCNDWSCLNPAHMQLTDEIIDVMNPIEVRDPRNSDESFVRDYPVLPHSLRN